MRDHMHVQLRYPAVKSAHELLSLMLLYQQPVYTLDEQIVCTVKLLYNAMQ